LKYSFRLDFLIVLSGVRKDVNGEKNLRTIWEELGIDFPEIFNLCTTQTLENTVMDQEMKRPMTETPEKRLKTVIPRETSHGQKM
jgi:hypothetical protein